MFGRIDINFYETVELFINSYKNVDFRSVLFRMDNTWLRALTVMRFSNEDKISINQRYKKLGFQNYTTKNFKIIGEVVKISDWEEKICELYDEINDDEEFYDYDESRYNEAELDRFETDFIQEFKAHYLTPNFNYFLTKVELKNHNSVHFYYNVPNKREHHNRLFEVLSKEILTLGEDSFYKIINRVLELEGFSSDSAMFISVVLPTYLELRELDLSKGILSANVLYHNIFDGSQFFIRIFSSSKYTEDSYKDSKSLS